MSDLPPPPPPGGGFTPPPPPPPPPPPAGGGFTPSPPPAGYVPPAPGGYTPPGAGYASPRTDGLAIGSLIAGIASVICFWTCAGILIGPAAAIMGFIARNRIAASGGTVGGGGLALAGLILGVVGFIGSALTLVWFIFAASYTNSTG